MTPSVPMEIMLSANKFNRISIALPIAINSAMDRGGLTSLTRSSRPDRKLRYR
jgi:hypothetical protein